MNTSLIHALKQHWRKDLYAGFMVSLIALPLCLGIALASGVPPMSGLISAVVGGMIIFMLNGSTLVINGPAAGLATIVLMTINGFKTMAPLTYTPEQTMLFAYKCTLAIGVCCGILQLLFSLIKAGKLSYIFPSSVVHGMMAAIGIMIIIKQLYTSIGVKANHSEILSLFVELPNALKNINPEILIITFVSLFLLVIVPKLNIKILKYIPVQLVTVLVGIGLGHFFMLEQEHSYLFLNHHEYIVGPKFLVSLPNNPIDGFVLPDFRYVLTPFGIKMIIIYSLVASLESLLTASAIDKIDPQHRTTNFNKELFAKGIGNILSSLIGGLPMIAEVVRSSANVSNGAKSVWANFFHGAFLFLFICFGNTLLHQIPLATLASLLIVVGYKLTAPKEFIHAYKLGKEQLIIFFTTIVFTLIFDLLIGIIMGIILKMIIHKIYGVSLKHFFKPFFTVFEDKQKIVIDVQHSAVFSNYLGLKKQLDKLPKNKTLIINLTNVAFIDSTVLTHLFDMKKKYAKNKITFEIIGLEKLESSSNHPLSIKKIK